MTQRHEYLDRLRADFLPEAPHASCPQDSECRPAVPSPLGLFIDAGVGHTRLRVCLGEGEVAFDRTVASNCDLRATLAACQKQLPAAGRGKAQVFVTGKLAALVQETLPGSKSILPTASAWLAARSMLREETDPRINSLAIVELSASGYLLVGVDRDGALKDDLLVVNPRCGAGSGINLDRILQKLGLERDAVDPLLAAYAGEAGRNLRARTTIRADRCGVFSSSATISDKNQGIPLDVALATTLKSEVMKACRKLPPGFDKVCLTGRVFHWRFARECAEDWLREQGVKEVVADPDNTRLLQSLQGFVQAAGPDAIVGAEPRLMRQAVLDEYPAMAELKRRYEADHRYLRLEDTPLAMSAAPAGRALHLALDVGSTMAKVVLADAESGAIVHLSAYSNAGDTIETIKRVFEDIVALGSERLPLRGIGITGSARYQVQQALEHIYPELAGRVIVLVENYAHARGSIALAREHVERLKALGVAEVNEDFCLLVDIGGEDTKVSSIALREAELFGNAMNLKCSAGTGSLMDTLTAMFRLADVGAACAEAFQAPKAMAINATCAVFLMENARKLQLQGVPRDQILASANWAIVENMARSLWTQLQIPAHAVVLLHGQTMLSEPLPLAVTHRLQSYLDTPAYALVPPHPGHRACLGLINTLRQTAPGGRSEIAPGKFLAARFEKRVVQCHGAACADKAACCNRSQLTCRGADGRKLVSFTVGGCSAINELLAKQKDKTALSPVRDTYKEIWDFVAAHHPRSDDPGRLVIPRSFAVSEWAYFLARFFERLGVPVHVDNVRDTDLTEAQPLFNVDTCAPHIGAVGQFRRLASEPHGLILAPQIEYLPTGGRSMGRTCTTNQGGIAVAMNLARLARPQARFHLFHVDLGELDTDALLGQVRGQLGAVFRHYGLRPDDDGLRAALAGAIADHVELRRSAADLAAGMAEEALTQGIPVALVVGREYILNPGIFDSHVRRLLRDKRMVVLPSYVLDLDLNPDYGHIYWRNPHFIVSLLDAVARRNLHRHLRHPRLAEAFRRLEAGPDLLPVVQVSTFSCGPDSVVQPFIAEIMKRRPFLLIQSDAVIKELAHLENRVNTYVKQLQLRLHERLAAGNPESFEIRTLDDLLGGEPIDRARDVICFPTLSDNRVLTSIFRGAGYTCIDNYADDTYDLYRLVRTGRRSAGDAVCTPLAAIYADLEAAAADFARRRAAGDPLLAGKRRLLYFDSRGPGPCRQGQYVDVHRLLWHRHVGEAPGVQGDAGCPAALGQGVVQFLVGQEAEGYRIGIDEWLQARVYLGVILQGVLHALLFAGGAACRDFEDYQRFRADFLALKVELYARLERFRGPGRAATAILRPARHLGPLAEVAKYFAYRLHGRELWSPLRRFAATWLRDRPAEAGLFRIALTGEGYMRVAQAEEIFRVLLANLGFRRFRLAHMPAWSYVEWLLEEFIELQNARLERLHARGGPAAGRGANERAARRRIRSGRQLQFILRHLIAGPLYRAANLPMPAPSREAAHATRELIPTLRPLSEIATYVGEAMDELRAGTDLVLNVGPNGCMVATMGEALTPAITAASASRKGRIQHLFSADGDVNEELLTLALLKAMGPEQYYGVSVAGREGGSEQSPALSGSAWGSRRSGRG